MSQSQIQLRVVQQVLRVLPERIRTRHVSEHPVMVAGHPGDVTGDDLYHRYVGKFLSQNCADVQLLSSSSHKLGALWRNLLSTPQSPPEPNAGTDHDATHAATTAADSFSDELGPQCASDQPFTARMRRHQSWFRAHVLKVSFGTGPTAPSTAHYGNMLRPADAQRGLNFITPAIFAAAKARLAQRIGVVEPFRLLHNLLSSQPLCFNVFAPLAADLALATRLLQTLPGLSAARVTRVEIEHTPGHPAAYLDDRTAFDAYIEYEQTDGQRAFLGIEVKLTEPFSRDQYDAPAYRRWMTGTRAPWRPEAAQHVARLEHNQLWRDHLLAIAHRDQPGSAFAHGRLMLLRHPGDRSCERIVQGYVKLLNDGDDTFIDLTLDRLVALWETALACESEREWLTALKTRYLDLHHSERVSAAGRAPA